MDKEISINEVMDEILNLTDEEGFVCVKPEVYEMLLTKQARYDNIKTVLDIVPITEQSAYGSARMMELYVKESKLDIIERIVKGDLAKC